MEGVYEIFEVPVQNSPGSTVHLSRSTESSGSGGYDEEGISCGQRDRPPKRTLLIAMDNDRGGLLVTLSCS